MVLMANILQGRCIGITVGSKTSDNACRWVYVKQVLGSLILGNIKSDIILLSPIAIYDLQYSNTITVRAFSLDFEQAVNQRLWPILRDH